MAFPIGFTAERPPEEPAQRAVSQPPAARPSVVQVHFDKRNMTLAYIMTGSICIPGIWSMWTANWRAFGAG